MKVTKDELKKKINDLNIDDDTKISLLEDIEDSMDVATDTTDMVDKATYDALQSDYDSLKQKYKDRFLTKEDEKNTDENKDVEEVKEDEVIDVKEI